MKFKINFRTFGAIFFTLLSGCANECPNSKQYVNLEPQRVRELTTKISNMKVSTLVSFARKHGFKVSVTESGMSIDAKLQSIILKFNSDTSESKKNEILSSLGASGSRPEKVSIRQTFRSSGAMELRVPQAVSYPELLAMVQALNEVSSVAYATPNRLFRVRDIPADPDFDALDNLNPASSRRPILDIKATSAWSKNRGSRSVKVGVIDTGIDYNHPDLSQNIWTNPGESGLDTQGRDKRSNLVDDDGNGYVDDFHGWDFVNNDNDPMDDHSHGTHVAGTIGAVGNNGVGIVGVNWEVSLVPLKFLDLNGSGSLADAVKAIEYATMMNIPITNNSWGGGGYDATLEAAIKAAGDKGFLFVAAAGNWGMDNDGPYPSYPASYQSDNILSVAAVDILTGALADFSNFGATSVHLAAPGVSVYSTKPLALGSYDRLSGTSMATPHVAGAAALIKSYFPYADYKALKARLMYSTTKLAALNGKVASGGYLNLLDILEEDSVPPSSVTSISTPLAGITSLRFTWPASGDDGSGGQASSYQARLSKGPVVSEADWNAAEQVKLILRFPSQSGGKVSGSISFLPTNKKGYLNIRALDNVGNLSSIGESIPYALSVPQALFSRPSADRTDGMTFSPPFNSSKSWGPENVSIKGKQIQVFSDSRPTALNSAGHYENDVNAIMGLPPINLLFPDALIEFDTKLSCETNSDFAYLEYNRNNEIDPGTGLTKWSELGAWSNMNCNWTRVSLQFGYLFNPGDLIQLRFRFATDSAGREDGWLIKGIQVTSLAAPEPPADLTLSVYDNPGENKLEWVDKSNNETRFEVGYFTIESAGKPSFFKLVEEVEANRTLLNYPHTAEESLSPLLRVRACVDSLCSKSSPTVAFSYFTSQPVYRRFRARTGDYLFTDEAQSVRRNEYAFEGEAFRVFKKAGPNRVPLYSCLKTGSGTNSILSGSALSGSPCTGYLRPAMVGKTGLLGFVEKKSSALTPILSCTSISPAPKKYKYTSDPVFCKSGGFNQSGSLGFGP
jgi:hypothetical protein